MTRIISGAALALGFLALTWYGSVTHFLMFAELLCAVGIMEMAAMLHKGGRPVALAVAVASGMALVFAMYTGQGALLAGTLGACVIASGAAAVFRAQGAPMETMVNTLASALYVGAPAGALMLLRAAPDGAALVILIVAANAMGDTGAYYTGRAIGKRKLAPSISPNKTVEGFFGGVAGALAGAVAVNLILPAPTAMAHAIAAGLLAGLIGPVGDLVESAVKRANGVKDSGTLIPGHGGVLDRVDSLLFSASAFYLYLLLVPMT